MPDCEPNIKTCQICGGISCLFNKTIIEVEHWHCVECGAIEIVKEEEK